MNYEVQYSAEARQDLKDIFNYLSLEASAVEAAKKIVFKITKKIKSLKTMPHRYSLYKKEPWQELGLRFLIVGNYLIFYLVDDDIMMVVSIVRIMYGGMDIINHL